MRTISFLTIDKEFTVCIENPKTLLNIKISILDLKRILHAVPKRNHKTLLNKNINS